MPVHEADWEEIIEEIWLEFDIGEVVVVIPQIRKVDLVIGGSRQSL